jgi:ribosome-associated heat shock protein Hsp15
MMRLDQWLWAVRLFKTRALAADAIKAGHVRLNGDPVKPAKEPKPGDTITARQGIIIRTLRVIGSPPYRVGAKLVPQYAEDLTPPAEYERAREVRFRPIAPRPRGSGRPTKRDRRDMDRLTPE